jgi:transmembrane sensor
MSKQPVPGLLNAQIREEAVEWFVTFCEEVVDLRARQEFNAWLRRSPEHVRAYLRISAFWEDAEDLKKNNRHGIDQIVARALAESNVVALGESMETPPTTARQRRATRHWAVPVAIAAACTCVGVVAWLLQHRAPIYSTGAGEQRLVTLTDGSTVQLNARSRVRVRYSKTQRDVDLLNGQALFKVAKTPTRSFIVHSDGTSVRAVGTEFDVYRRHGATVVTVVEGRVAVTGSGLADPALSVQTSADSDAASGTASTRPEPIFVSAGERVVALAHELDPPEPANAAVATAWTEGKLVFDSVPLKDVLEEFNRYLPRPLVVTDTQLLNIHISGVFSATESQQFVEFLHQRFGTASRETESDIRISRP